MVSIPSLNSYEPSMLLEAAEAFSSVGASAIAAGLQEIVRSSPPTMKN
jgi:hypothetical protein